VTMDADLRWIVTLHLARLGAISEADIDAEVERDSSSEGVVHATRCRSALPTAEAKERAWTQITTDADLANYELYAACEGFWHPTQAAVTAPYVDRFFAETAGTEKYRRGVVAMANAGTDANGSQFMLFWDDSSSLDAKHEFTIFGEMDSASTDVVASIASQGRDAKDRPIAPAEIISVSPA